MYMWHDSRCLGGDFKETWWLCPKVEGFLAEAPADSVTVDVTPGSNWNSSDASGEMLHSVKQTGNCPVRASKLTVAS